MDRGEPFRDTINAALARLPDDVQAFAATRLYVKTIGSAPGSCAGSLINLTRKAELADYMLVICDASPDLDAVIAHEVAHAVLRHTDKGNPMSSEQAEREARALAGSWGFTGFGVDW